MIKADLLWTILWMFWSGFYGFFYQLIRINLLFKKTQIRNDSSLSKHALRPLHSLNRDGIYKFFKNWDSKRPSKLLVTLPGTTAKGTAQVFLIALHTSTALPKAVLKFYNFHNGGIKKTCSPTFLLYCSIWSSIHFLCIDVCKVGWSKPCKQGLCFTVLHLP